MIAALLTRMSSRPNAFSRAANRPGISPGLPMSAFTATAVPPDFADGVHHLVRLVLALRVVDDDLRAILGEAHRDGGRSRATPR